MMRALKLLLLLGALALGAGPAVALDVHKMNVLAVNVWMELPAGEARANLANKTIRIEVTGVSAGEWRPLLGTGSLILYTAKGGKLLWWTARSKAVQTGNWSIWTVSNGWSMPCFKFDALPKDQICFLGGTKNFREWAAGNPLGLKVGAAISGGSSLADIAGKLGL